MDASTRKSWVLAALLAGVAYLVIGRAFAAPANHVQAWRLAAWLLSGIVFATHIWYEHFRLRQVPRITALHAATGVAIGGFTLAVRGALHSIFAASPVRPIWLVALVAWPLLTGVPAFLAALVAALVLARVAGSTDARESS